MGGQAQSPQEKLHPQTRQIQKQPGRRGQGSAAPNDQVSLGLRERHA